MKFSVAIALFLALVAVAQALPSRTAREDAAPAEAVEPVADAAAAEPAAAAETAVAEADKHAHHAHHGHHVEAKPEVHPHPLNWHIIYNAFKAVAPVVGGLIEPLLLNIAHGVVGAVIETINTGFSIPAPPPHPYHHAPEPHHPEPHHPEHHE